MVNWEVTEGQYLRCIWIKALKHIQIWKQEKKNSLSPFLFTIYIWQSKLWPAVVFCLSKAAQIESLGLIDINYILNALVENVSQRSTRPKL